jgi:UDP-N-acetylmuramate-alanine ligase
MYIKPCTFVGNNIDFSKLDIYNDIIPVCTLFKQWLRDMPDGIVPKKFYTKFIEAGGICVLNNVNYESET